MYFQHHILLKYYFRPSSRRFIVHTETLFNQDANRLTLMYFVIGALDLLGELDKTDTKSVVDYIYALQVLPDKDIPALFSSPPHGHICSEVNVANCGFR